MTAPHGFISGTADFQTPFLSWGLCWGKGMCRVCGLQLALPDQGMLPLFWGNVILEVGGCLGWFRICFPTASCSRTRAGMSLEIFNSRGKDCTGGSLLAGRMGAQDPSLPSSLSSHSLTKPEETGGSWLLATVNSEPGLGGGWDEGRLRGQLTPPAPSPFLGTASA